MKPNKFKLSGSTVLNAIGAVIIVYLLVILAQTVKRNYDMNRQVHELNGQIELLKEQKDQLAYNIQYYKTDSFREREAREKLGLQLPGESVIIIPQKSPQATTSPKTEAKVKVETSSKSNVQQWLDFLSGGN